MVQTFYRRNNIVEVQNQICKSFPGGNEPDKNTIRRIVNKFENRGSVLMVRQSLAENTHLSARRSGLDIPASIFNEIT